MALQDVQRRMVEYSQIIPKMAVIHVRGASDLRVIMLFSVQYSEILKVWVFFK